jgi:hypothetical protein
MEINKTSLDKIVMKLFEKENAIMHDYFKTDSEKDLDVYKNFYIDNCEYLNSTVDIKEEIYLKYLKLYTTNQMYEKYKKRND